MKPKFRLYLEHDKAVHMILTAAHTSGDSVEVLVVLAGDSVEVLVVLAGDSVEVLVVLAGDSVEVLVVSAGDTVVVVVVFAAVESEVLLDSAAAVDARSTKHKSLSILEIKFRLVNEKN